jgi:hypothetical protein
MRRTTATAVLLAMMYSGVALPTAAQEQSLEGLVGEARDSSGAAAEEEISEADLFSEEELDDLVAPVALYPDALLAQVLVASTFPLQIVKADRILDRSEEMSDDELAAAVEAQEWDPSVLVLLSGFPTVVQRMADDLEQTEQLGLAMAQQDQEVLAAVQRMRARAEDTGYLDDNAAQVVEHRGDHIAIEPADPDVIYVPRYDPGVAFTSPPTRQPVIAPSTGGSLMRDPLVAGAIAFGSALLIDQLFGDDDEDDDEGWDDYWHRSRPIDWGAREVYPRPYRWRADNRWRDIAWSQERDRYWDRQADRWRREAEEARRAAWRERREARAWQVWRDPDTGATRLRPRDWRDAEARADARRMRQEAVQRRERREAAEAVRERREAAERRAVQQRRQQAAERRDRREAVEARQERREAAEARKAAQERRQEAMERREAREARQKRQEAAERRQAVERRRAAAEREERQQAAQRAAEERRKRQAAAQREQRERAAAERQRAERAERAERQQREAARRERAERAERQQREAARRESAERAERQQREAARRESAERAERQQREAARRERAERAERQQREAARRAAEQQRAEEREAPRRAQQRDCRGADTARERQACRRGQ